MAQRTVSALVLAAHLVLVLVALVLLWLAGVVGTAWITGVVCAGAFAKTLAYGQCVRLLVMRVSRLRTAFHAFLFDLCGVMFVLMASFATDFYVLYSLDPGSLAAMNPEAPALENLFNCWYFSVLNFSFFGVSDILPTALATRFLLTLEALASFLTLVLILSDFVALRESIRT